MYIPLTFEGSQAKCLFASGGVGGYFISGSQQWQYHWFTGSATLEVQKGTIDNVQIYVIGGGGAGGNRNSSVGGGGGGGGGVNYTMNGRLFQGTYSIDIGRGGYAVAATNSDGLNGVTSSFIGSNVNLVAGGGGGGKGLDSSAGGTGGLPNGGAGGSGGTTSAANGVTGVLINVASQSAAGFGCGGGGASNVSNPGDQGFSCNDTQYGAGGNGNNFGGDGANRYGMGGGGGNQTNSSADGGSGSVIIQYPIYDYCSNYFNETGSCGCRQITFDTTFALNYYPDRTGSFIYMPCGGDRFVSGSLIAYSPLTVCAVSNSYFSEAIPAANPINLTITQGFVNSGPECVSASLAPTPCSIESFVPTCTSSIVTIYTPSGSGGNPNTFGYVAKNETTHSIYTSTSARVKYICISTGSIYGNNQIYPQVLTGNNVSLFNTASCNNVTFTSAAAFPANRFYSYYNCNGAYTNGSFNGPGSATRCVDTTAPFGFVATSQIGTSVTIGGNCLSGSFDTASCGCP